MPSEFCGSASPGPAAYHLPSLVGTKGLDQTRWSSPAYTIKGRSSKMAVAASGGVFYNVTGVTRFGKVSPPSYSIRARPKPMGGSSWSPGPGAHAPEKHPDPRKPYPPRYGLAARLDRRTTAFTPAPNAYLIPSALGPHVPDKMSAPAFSMKGVTGLAKSVWSPAPNEYCYDTNAYRQKAPTPKLLGRNQGVPDSRLAYPSPAHYYPMYNQRTRPPRFSFGVKHSRCSGLYIVPKDNEF